MSFKATLRIFEKDYPLLDLDYGLKQQTDSNSRPLNRALDGKLYLKFASTKDDTALYDAMFSPTQMVQGMIRVYKRDGFSKSFDIEFANAYIVHLQEDYNAESTQPLSMQLTISPQIQRIRNTIFELPANPSNPFEEEVAVTERETQREEEQEEEQDFRFILNFQRTLNYKGEYGFDWMREEYKNICKNYDKLKAEYTPITIEGNEYFVPWLSMFPGQKGVKLLLEVEKIEDLCERNATDQDIVKLPAKNGIRFSPDIVKASNIYNNIVEVEVFCEKPITKSFSIEAVDKDDNIVGKINIFKNSNYEKLKFGITPVRLLRKQVLQSDIDTINNQMDKGFGGVSTDIQDDLKNLETFLNKRSLNQALLQCEIGKVIDVIIDEAEWIENDLIIDSNCVFKGSLLDKFNQEFKKQHPQKFKSRGITMYLSPLKHSYDGSEKGAGGYGNMRDVDAKGLSIFKSNLHHKESFVHEIAHVAGLEHSFKEDDELTPAEVVLYNERKREIDNYFDLLIKSRSKTKNEIGQLWNDYKDEMRQINSKLYTFNRNPYKFKQKTTDNFMDYFNNRLSFWKFQWIALQDDIIKFYNY